MAGYDWTAGKSNNAVLAEADGKMPATAAAKYAREHLGISGCTAADIAHALVPSEWHHTSKFFNATDYYDMDQIDAWEVADLKETVARRKEFERLLKAHGQDGRVEILTRGGEVWWVVDKKARFDRRALANLRSQIERGHGEDWMDYMD